MEQRDRLIEIIQKSVGGCARNWAEIIADGLIANGVVALPIDVGDMVYANRKNWATGEYEVSPYQVTNITITKNKKGIWTKKYRAMWFIGGKTVDAQINFSFADIGKKVFLTREEAERELERRKK